MSKTGDVKTSQKYLKNLTEKCKIQLTYFDEMEFSGILCLTTYD